MDSQIIILFARPYNLIDQNTGEHKQGVSVHYIDSSSSFNDPQNGYGCPIFKSSLPVEVMNSITSIPGVYTPVFSTYMSKGMRCSKLTDVSLVGDVSLWKK